MAFTPRRVRFLVARFTVRCFWCGYAVAAGESAAYYPDERQTAHDACHREVCT